MTRGTIIFFAVLALLAEVGYAQLSAYTSPLDVPTDPRCVAMGESFVALPENPTALMSNPAGLAGLIGGGASYAQRSMDWMRGLESFKYHGANAYVALPFGVFGIQYGRLNTGEMIVRTASSPEGIGRVKSYIHDFGIGFGTKIWGNLAVGVAAKFFDMVWNSTGPNVPGWTDLSSNPAYLFDAGAMYSIADEMHDSTVQGAFAVGIAVQNAGTEFKLKYSTEVEASDYNVPRYLRVGFAYTLRILSRQQNGLQPLALALTGEYRRPLRPNQDTWGFGLECTLFECISARAGGVMMPFTSIYGEQGNVMFRGGAGLHIPLPRMGLRIPLVVSANYALIPINRFPNAYMVGDKSSLSAFSFEVQYTEDLLSSLSP
jgi:hypothetical protein